VGVRRAAKPPPNILFWVLLAAKPPATPRKQRLRQSLKDVDAALNMVRACRIVERSEYNKRRSAE
jgi:hypothetical protein